MSFYFLLLKKSEFFEIGDKTKILEFPYERNTQFLPADQALSFLWQYVGLSCPEFFLCVTLPSAAITWQRSPGLPENGTPHPPEIPELVTLLLAYVETAGRLSENLSILFILEGLTVVTTVQHQ